MTGADESGDLRRSWLVALGLLTALTAVSFLLGGTPRDHGSFTVALTPGAPLEEEALARHVRFSEPFELATRQTLTVSTAGRGAVLVSLIRDEDDGVREQEVDVGDSVRFSSVEPGHYRVRATGSGEGDATLRVTSGGVPHSLTILAAILVLAPVVWRTARAHRRRRP
ncbi:MAG: hypothetical protein H6724_17205 [Sandaracinus sp.]|nr:hypothetical protein [Myxococcales bacterium]MCB9600377.1 hypothetical protein [Sandaracinus sp.]MCB9621181.1 hypothetical protein [Sandaracinus sp.]